MGFCNEVFGSRLAGPALVGCTASAVFGGVAKRKIVKPVAVVELGL